MTYAARDVQTTWECYVALRDRFAEFSLTQTPLPRIYSEASLGKAHLREMNVAPWREVQPDFDPRMTGIILSTYYGGRTEVRIRRQVRQVAYCDFLSMYPTVCVLMDLWRFVTANGIRHCDATEETRDFLATLTSSIMQQPERGGGCPSWCRSARTKTSSPCAPSTAARRTTPSASTISRHRHADVVHPRRLHHRNAAWRQATQGSPGDPVRAAGSRTALGPSRSSAMTPTS